MKNLVTKLIPVLVVSLVVALLCMPVTAEAKSKKTTFSKSLGVEKQVILDWLEDHCKGGKYPNYYLGTPYYNYSKSKAGTYATFTSPKGDPKKSVKKGYAGMNCAGFPDHVMEHTVSKKMIKKVDRQLGRSHAFIWASSYYRWAKKHNVKMKCFPTAKAALKSGYMEKGDILFWTPRVWGVPDKNGKMPDNHVGFFWGKNSHDDKFWHSGGKNKITKVKPFRSNSKLWVIKL